MSVLGVAKLVNSKDCLISLIGKGLHDIKRQPPI